MSDRFDALIFDCDSVLVNSEEIAQHVELACLAEIGMQYQRDDFVPRFSGMSTSKFIRDRVVTGKYCVLCWRAATSDRSGKISACGFFTPSASEIKIAANFR